RRLGPRSADAAGSPRASALRAPLGAVLRPRLLTVGDAGGIERSADHLVPVPRQVLDATAAHEHDRVLLQVVPLTRDVGADLDAVREPDAGDLAQRRVRLLGGHRRDARADPTPLRGALKRGRLGLVALGRATFADELIDSGHRKDSLADEKPAGQIPSRTG